jgi:hypothetical protein
MTIHMFRIQNIELSHSKSGVWNLKLYLDRDMLDLDMEFRMDLVLD